MLVTVRIFGDTVYPSGYESTSLWMFSDRPQSQVLQAGPQFEGCGGTSRGSVCRSQWWGGSRSISIHMKQTLIWANLRSPET